MTAISEMAVFVDETILFMMQDSRSRHVEIAIATKCDSLSRLNKIKGRGLTTYQKVIMT